jgi:hypothetical protein
MKPEGNSMEVTPPTDLPGDKGRGALMADADSAATLRFGGENLGAQVDREPASGRSQSGEELVEPAARQAFDERQRAQQRLEGLRRIGRAVDQAGLYEKTLVADEG